MSNFLTDEEVVKNKRSTCAWINIYGVPTELARVTNAQTIVEVGVAYGFHAEHLLEELPNIQYTGVDPYQTNYDPNDTFVAEVHRLLPDADHQRSFDRLHNVVQNKLTKYGSRASLMRKFWQDAAKSFRDGEVDLIYIDGNHTYEGVTKDLQSWWSKMNQENGIMCGDDWEWVSVYTACNDFFKSKGVKYCLIRKRGIECHPRWVYVFGGEDNMKRVVQKMVDSSNGLYSVQWL